MFFDKNANIRLREIEYKKIISYVESDDLIDSFPQFVRMCIMKELARREQEEINKTLAELKNKQRGKNA